MGLYWKYLGSLYPSYPLPHFELLSLPVHLDNWPLNLQQHVQTLHWFPSLWWRRLSQVSMILIKKIIFNKACPSDSLTHAKCQTWPAKFAKNQFQQKDVWSGIMMTSICQLVFYLKISISIICLIIICTSTVKKWGLNNFIKCYKHLHSFYNSYLKILPIFGQIAHHWLSNLNA